MQGNDLGYQINDFGVFLDGGSYLGRTSDAKFPDIIRKTEDHTPGGSLGVFGLDVGQYEKMEFEIPITDVSTKTITLVGENKINQHKIELRGIARSDRTGDKKTVRITIGGRFNAMEREAFKTGEVSKITLKGVATSYEEAFGGTVVRHLDLLNRIDVTNGVDAQEFNRNFIGG